MNYSIMFTIDSWYILIPVFFIYMQLNILLNTFRKKKYGLLQYVFVATFAIYLLFVIHLVLFPLAVNLGKYAHNNPWYGSINYIPVLTIDFMTFFLNIIMFIPMGMYLPLLNKRFDSLRKCAKMGFVMSLAIELSQLLGYIILGNKRIVDVNDLIANTLGCIAGYSIIRKLIKMQLFVNTFTRFKLADKISLR